MTPVLESFGHRIRSCRRWGRGRESGRRAQVAPMCAVTPPSLGFSAWRPGSQDRCLPGRVGACLCCGGHCSGTPALMGRDTLPLPQHARPSWVASTQARVCFPTQGVGLGAPPSRVLPQAAASPALSAPQGPSCPATSWLALPGNQPLRTVDPAEQGEATRLG